MASKYQPSYVRMAQKACELGAIDVDLCELFGIARDTLNQWRGKHSAFAAACEGGKEVADKRVEQALFKRAVGYSHAEDDIRTVDGEIVITPTTKHYAPDTVACIFWLKNRDRANWRDKVEAGITDRDGNDVPVDKLDTARRIAFTLALGAAANDSQKAA